MTLTLRDDDINTRPIVTLWRLAWNDNLLSCAVCRDGQSLQLRLESPTAVILAQPFELQPRMFARTQLLRESLERRGWSPVPSRAG
jgi:hypothetical protein